MSRSLAQAMRDKSLALGTYFTTSSPELMEIVGYCGLNHVVIDQMFSALDWATTANLVRAADLYGVCSVVRVQTYPWGSRGGDTRLPAEIARALGIGAGAAMASIRSIEELEGCLRVQRDAAHGRIWISPDVQEWEKQRERGKQERAQQERRDGGPSRSPDEAGDGFFVVPLIELTELIDAADELVSLPGLRAVAVGIHDICAAVGHPFEVDHPDVWRHVDRLVAAADPYDISVWVNVGYRFRTVDEMVARIGRLRAHGIYVVQCQGPETLVQHMLKDIVAGTRDL